MLTRENLLDVPINKRMKKSELVDYIKKVNARIKTKINNSARLRNAENKDKLNVGLNQNIRKYEKELGRYKRGAKKGQFKNPSKSWKKETLINIARQGKLILRKDVYSEVGRKWKQENFDKAYKEFISNRVDEEGNPYYTKEDFKNITDIYNVLGKDLTAYYGSEDIADLYNNITEYDTNISLETIYDIFNEFRDKGLDQYEYRNAVYNAILDTLEGTR